MTPPIKPSTDLSTWLSKGNKVEKIEAKKPKTHSINSRFRFEDARAGIQTVEKANEFAQRTIYRRKSG